MVYSQLYNFSEVFEKWVCLAAVLSFCLMPFNLQAQHATDNLFYKVDSEDSFQSFTGTLNQLSIVDCFISETVRQWYGWKRKNFLKFYGTMRDNLNMPL